MSISMNNSTYVYFYYNVLELKNTVGMQALELICIRQAAQFASTHHTGRFADGGIENIALGLGVDLDARWPATGDGPPYRTARAEPASGRRILHVATQVLDTGGHTRTIKNWIRHDPVSCHSLLIVRQGGTKVPLWLLETVQRSGGNLVVLPMGVAVIS